MDRLNRCRCFFFNDTATTEIYTLSLHDALPIWRGPSGQGLVIGKGYPDRWASTTGMKWSTPVPGEGNSSDRKSTRLNSSHANISYAVFCLKKKKIALVVAKE